MVNHPPAVVPPPAKRQNRTPAKRPNQTAAVAAAGGDPTLRVAETFVSLQGEGSLTGRRSLFIRTSGCNLRCWFCDTPYASWHPEGEQRGVEELLALAKRSDVGHVVLTGGEPLLFESIVRLNEGLRDAGLHVTIETAGTIDRPVRCDLLSISPKLTASGPDPAKHPGWALRHQTRRMPIAVMRRLIDAAVAVQVKFVVQNAGEFDEIDSVVDQLGADAADVWIMPQGRDVATLDAAAPWLRPWTAARGYRDCDRMQIRWYGDRRGT